MKKRNLALLAMVFVAIQGWADIKGHLSVAVTDDSGNPLPGATVIVTNLDPVINRSGVSNADGVAQFRLLPPGMQYVITVTMPGFGTVKREGIRVSIGTTYDVPIAMQPEGVQEEMVIVGERPVVDQTTQITGEFLELGFIESLPTGRNYQDYLQLVTSVLPTNDGNPAAKGGLNYSDIRGEQGSSSDNFYYIDGVNTTDHVTGTFGANFNSEIIAEQQVLTGGYPAEYEGAPGLMSNVVTKTGTNSFTGSINYYFQDSSLVSDTDEGIPEQSEYERFDTAVVLSGPIIKDKLFFLASWQIKEETEDVASLEGGGIMRSVDDEADYQYFKVNFLPSEVDNLELIYSGDPREFSGSDDANRLNNRDRGQEQGGSTLSLSYTRLIGETMTFEARYGKIDRELKYIPADDSAGPLNDVRFRADQEFTAEETQLGGYDYIGADARNRETLSAKFSYFLDTDNMGSHEFKFGAGFVENQNVVRDEYPSGAHWESASITAGVTTMADLEDLGIFSDTDYDRLASSINSSFTHLIGTLDINGDGSVSSDEIRAAPAGFTDGNPHGQVNGYRIREINAGVNDMKSEGLHFFIQDSIDLEKWHFDLGVRFEEFEHFSATGQSVHKFDWTAAPRLGVSYDVQGDGKQKAWGWYGRYYDPIRGNMTDFAGAWTGWERYEEAYVAGEWVDFRTRGGSETIDALFAPTTKTPYSDEITLGYQIDLGNNMSLEVVGTDRATRDILEDYDISPYDFVADGQGYYTDPELVGVYALPLDYFGYSYQDLLSNPSNYVIATMAGGKRDYRGYDVTFRKNYANNWQALASYTFGDAKGNSNSDSNADLQGDFEQLDPRVPGMYARQPGSIEHLLKLAGSYHFDNGLQVGGSYRWNSGLYYTRATYFYRRYLPVGWDEVDVQDPTSGIADGIIGAYQTPSFGILDLRVSYHMRIADNYKAEFFVDVFNAMDNQAVTEEEGRIDSSLDFGVAKGWMRPRRFFLGARLSF